jgi:RecA/RadA recombinase
MSGGCLMNEKRVVLVLSKDGVWEDKTDEIIECVVASNGVRIHIRFKSNPEKLFPYSQERVRQLDEPITTHNPDEVQLRVRGKVLLGVDGIAKYADFYLVTLQGKRRPYSVSDVSVERNIAVDPACKTALSYFRSITEMVGVQNSEDESLLTKQFDFLSRVSDASVLATYLTPDTELKALKAPEVLIYPFGTNVSQKAAVEKAFQSQVVLVQGPPGTGKTQTILNVVANAIRLGQTVAVVSNNNAATQNVADKLEKHGLGFLLAPLGRRANKETFIERQSSYPDWIYQPCEEGCNLSQVEGHLKLLTNSLDRLIQANNERAMLVGKISQTQAEFELHKRLQETTPSEEAFSLSQNLSAHDLLKLLVEVEEVDLHLQINFFRLVKEIFIYGMWGRKRRRQLFSEGAMVLRSLYYQAYLSELHEQLSKVESILHENNFLTVQQQVQEMSWKLLRGVVAERFRHQGGRTKFTSRDLWSKYDTFLKEYPVVFSTTHSIKTSLSPDCLYDLIILDESSQVDVATGTLALSCAKRAVIVGDEKQLPNVISSNLKQRTLDVWDKYGLSCQAWNYANQSLLSSAKAIWPEAPNVLLKEHYRCHPKIAGFFNQKFYDDQLVVMTKDEGESDVLQVIFTPLGNHARGRINQRQAEVIQQEIQPELRRKGVTDVGVIAPYQDQVAMLKQTLGTEVEVDTVHGFQGREKQAIIMSTVDNQIGEFVDDPQMLNVAVSRAQKSFTVIMSNERDNFDTNFGDLVRYIRHQNQLVKHSEVRSVFDFLYEDYAKVRKQFLDKHGRTSEWDSESLAEAVVRKVLTKPDFSKMSLSCMRHAPLAWLIGDSSNLNEREREFARHPWAHVDLLIYDTIGKLPVLGVEIDGWTFHRPGTIQSERDKVKNSVFKCIDLRLVRLSTTGSSEEGVIENALREIVCH